MDALIYGGGVAAAAAAVGLADRGFEVTVAGPTAPARWPMMLDGGINGGDDCDALFEATMRCGDHLADPEAVRAMCEQAPAVVRWLEGAHGVPFEREAGSLALRRLPGTPRAEARFVGAQTELYVARALERAAVRRGVTVLEPVELVELARSDGAVVGAVLRDGVTGALEAVEAAVVVLAAGGPQKLWRGEPGAIATERAIAVALRAGAVGADVDLVQDHPAALWRDGVPTVLSPAWRAEGAYLWLPDETRDPRVPRDIPSSERDRLADRAHPGWGELAPDDLVAAAVRRGFEQGRGLYDRKRDRLRRRVFLDVTHLPASRMRARIGRELSACERRFGSDPTERPLPVAPAAVGSLGGLWVRSSGDWAQATTLPGLFAVGPAAPLHHGCCRLGGNGLLADIVGAWRMVEPAWRWAREGYQPARAESVSEAIERAEQRSRGRSDGLDPYDAFDALVAEVREDDVEPREQAQERGVAPAEGPIGPARTGPDAFADLGLYLDAVRLCRAARAGGARRHAFVRFEKGGLLLLGGFEVDGERVAAAIDDDGVTRRYDDGHG